MSSIQISSSCLFFVLLASMSLPAQSNPSFAPAVGYSSGGYLVDSVAVADVNGDGIPDLVIANQCASSNTCFTNGGTVSVLVGNGDGSFKPAVLYGSGGEIPRSVAVADVNGDGIPDIVVANQLRSSSNASGPVGILLGNGDGTFQTVVTDGSGGFAPYAIAVGDLNGDGKPDLLVSNACGSNADCDDGSVTVLLGSGNGTFQTAVAYDLGHYWANSVAIADVNGDGKPDVIVGSCSQVGCNGAGLAIVLLGNGDGTLQAAVPYNSGGNGVISVAVADINGDGKLDLLLANRCGSVDISSCSSGSVGVLLGNGDGTFQNAVSYASGGTFAWSIAVGDVNGDGKPDLIVTNACPSSSNCITNGSLDVLLNNGDGTFQPAVDYDAGGEPTTLAVADLNGDGKPDAIVSIPLSSSSNFTTGSANVLINNEATTLYTLIDAVTEDVTNQSAAEMMLATLTSVQVADAKGHKAGKGHNGKADSLLKKFIAQVKAAQSASSVSAAHAAILIQEANALMM